MLKHNFLSAGPEIVHVMIGVPFAWNHGKGRNVNSLALVPFQYVFGNMRAISWYPSSHPEVLSKICYLLCVGRQSFIFSTKFYPSKSNLFLLKKHAPEFIRIFAAIAYAAEKTPFRFDLLPADFFHVFIFLVTTIRKIWRCAIYGCRVHTRIRNFTSSYRERVDVYCAVPYLILSIHIHQSRWFPWTPSLCSAKWSAETLSSCNRFRELTAFRFTNSTKNNWVRISCARAMHVKNFAPYDKRARNGIALGSDGRGQGVINFVSNLHDIYIYDGMRPHKWHPCSRRTKPKGFHVDCGECPSGVWTLECGKCKQIWISNTLWLPKGILGKVHDAVFCVPLQQVLYE